MNRVLRHRVPVDDQPHVLRLSGAVVHVATREVGVVEAWALDSGGPTTERTFRVVATGQPFSPEWQHVGTAIVPGGALVWHLVEQRR